MLIFSLFFHCSFSSIEKTAELYKDIIHPPLLTDYFMSLNPNLDFRKNSKSRKTLAAEPLIETDEERTPFLIDFDTSLVTEGPNRDPKMCLEVGQVVSWSMGVNHTCRETDIFTRQKEEALMGTLNNIAKYINRIIKVKHTDISVQPFQMDEDMMIIPEKNISTADHYVTIVIRPIDSNMVAGSSVLYINEKTYRPIQSVIMFDPEKLTDEIEDENSDDRYFFNLVFHEFMHSLGMSDLFYTHWINKATGLPYDEKDNIEIYSIPEYPESYFLQICTPKATEVAQRRLGRKTYPWGGRVCMELEDMGGPGTEYAHPKATVYRQDVMAGVPSKGDAVVSEVILALLEDMGWYTVNWPMAQQSTWGAPELLTPEETEKFPLKPVWKNMPSTYLYTPTAIFYLGHDYKSYGIMSARKYNVTEDPLNFTENGDLYLSDSQYYTLNEVFDYSLIKAVTYSCGKDKWSLVMTAGIQQMIYCVGGTLYEDYFEFQYNKTTYQCRTGQTVKVSDYLTVNCINVTKMNLVNNYLMQLPHDYGHIKLYSPDSESSEEGSVSMSLKVKAAFIALSAIVIICIIVIIVISVIFWRKRKVIHTYESSISADISTPII